MHRCEVYDVVGWESEKGPIRSGWSNANQAPQLTVRSMAVLSWMSLPQHACAQILMLSGDIDYYYEASSSYNHPFEVFSCYFTIRSTGHLKNGAFVSPGSRRPAILENLQRTHRPLVSPTGNALVDAESHRDLSRRETDVLFFVWNHLGALLANLGEGTEAQTQLTHGILSEHRFQNAHASQDVVIGGHPIQWHRDRNQHAEDWASRRMLSFLAEYLAWQELDGIVTFEAT